MNYLPFFRDIWQNMCPDASVKFIREFTHNMILYDNAMFLFIFVDVSYQGGTPVVLSFAECFLCRVLRRIWLGVGKI